MMWVAHLREDRAVASRAVHLPCAPFRNELSRPTVLRLRKRWLLERDQRRGTRCGPAKVLAGVKAQICLVCPNFSLSYR